MAEVIFKEMARPLELNWEADSAGTGSWHRGQDMDRRARTALVGTGFNPKTHRAKQFIESYFYDRNLIIALDMEHYEDLISLDKHRNNGKASSKIKLLMAYADNSPTLEVPDPYYGNEGDFKYALGLIEDGVRGLILKLSKISGDE